MANYISRVELHSAQYDDYENLHAYMERHGFQRVIHSSDGTRYQLPTGTYVIEDTSISLDQAYEAAKAAASETGKKYGLIVTNWTGAQWVGLPKV